MKIEQQAGLGGKFQQDPNIVSRVVADEVILVPIHRRAEDMDLIYTLNETAARVWELSDGQRSLAEIHQVLVREFEVDPAQAEKDLAELVEGLLGIGALVEAGNQPQHRHH